MCSGPRPSSRASSPALRPSRRPSSKPIDTSLLVDRLAHLIRSEKLDLSALLANPARPRIHHPTPPRPIAAAPVTPMPSPVLNDPNTLLPANRCTNTLPPPTNLQQFSSSSNLLPTSVPVTIMPPIASADRPLPISPPTPRRMAARGSHWSFLEKARFEAALHKYGPFAWDRIIEVVGTRTEKQVKAYAARYRRRKRLAARMHALAVQPQPYPPVVQPILPVQLPTQVTVKQHPDLQQAPKEEIPPVPLPSQAPKEEQQLEPSEDWFGGDMCGALGDDNVPMDDPPLFSGNTLSDEIFGSPGEDTELMSDSSEFDLLLDRAMEGQGVVIYSDPKPLAKGLEQETNRATVWMDGTKVDAEY